MLLHWLTKRIRNGNYSQLKRTELNGVDKHMTCPIAEYLKKKEEANVCLNLVQSETPDFRLCKSDALTIQSTTPPILAATALKYNAS